MAVHRGDYFATLVRYREFWPSAACAGARCPPAAYEPVWCAWGYERDFTVEQVLGTLPKARELGLVWAVLDDGWQTAEGDWYLDPKKFPRGDADMIALVKAIKARGHEAQAVDRAARRDPGSDLLRDHHRHAAAGQRRRGAGRDLVEQLLSVPGLSADGGTDAGADPQDHGRVGLRGPEDRRPASQRRRALLQPGARARAARRSPVERLQDFWQAIYREAVAINPEAVIEICPCGTSYAFHNMPYMNQAVASDPESSWQVRHKGKTIKALMGPSAAYAGDHVELSDRGDDFASTVGIGAVVSTKFTWPRDPKPENELLLTPAKESRMAAVDRALQREAAAGGQLPRRALRHRLRQARSPCRRARTAGCYYAFYADHWERPDRAARPRHRALCGDRLLDAADRLAPHRRPHIALSVSLRALPAARSNPDPRGPDGDERGSRRRRREDVAPLCVCHHGPVGHLGRVHRLPGAARLSRNADLLRLVGDDDPAGTHALAAPAGGSTATRAR